VFKDLEPYVCIFPNCPKAEELYDSRREWLAHEKDDHPQFFEKAKAAGKLACPLCNCEIAYSILEKHIAKHLQELALFSISTSNVGEDPSTDLLHNSARQSRSSTGSSRDPSEEVEPENTSPNDHPKEAHREDPRYDDLDRSGDQKRVKSRGSPPGYHRIDPREDEPIDEGRERSRVTGIGRYRDRFRRSPTYEPDTGDGGREEPSVTAWLPSAGIDYDVISEELSLFLGPNSTVERGMLRNVRHSNVTL
jgi:hypothetical protein